MEQIDLPQCQNGLFVENRHFLIWKPGMNRHLEGEKKVRLFLYAGRLRWPGRK
jgi:hypothetical protein